MKIFVYKVAAFSIPLFLLLFLVNYFGDAARLFDNEFERKLSDIVSNDQYVTNIDNYDERLFQKEIIINKNHHPNFVVLGSSRTMLINSKQISDSSFFNNSVSGASIEDLVSLFQLYKENNKLPKRVLIGIDPWTFNDNNGQKRWESLAEYYYRSQNQEPATKMTYFKYNQLFSFSYFQSSLKMIPRLIRGNTDPIPTRVKNNNSLTKLTDGSIVYGELFRNASPEIIRDKMESYTSGDIYSIENFNAISDRCWNEFEQLMTEMQKNEIKIEFFLAPYAPLVYDKVQKNYPMVLKTEDIVVQYASANHIQVYGSFNPYKFNLDERFFYDGMHLKESGIVKILQPHF